MRSLLIIAILALLASCELVQDSYDDETIRQCRAQPTPGDRLQCERDATDAAQDRELNRQRGMIEKDRYVLPAELCPADDKDACDFD